MIGKFVDSKNFFVEVSGPSVYLYTTAGIPGSGNVEPVAKANIVVSSYFLIPTNNGDYCVWFDKTGSNTAPVVSGIDTDKYVRVNVSADTTSGDVGTRMVTAIDAITGVSAEANSDGIVEIAVDDAGTYLPISDGNSGLDFTSLIKGYAANELVKFGNLNQLGKKDLLDIFDIDYNSTTDTLVVVGRVKNTTVITKTIRETNRVDFWVESRSFSNWIFG